MRFTRPGLSEAVIAAHFEYICAVSGSQRLAYVPVVASGYVDMHNFFLSKRTNFPTLSCRPNSLIIHYTSNNHLVRDDEMVLLDAGCEYKSATFLWPL
jgi:intermediate cleaving peptidase 55